MINLNSPTKSLEVLLAAPVTTNELEWTVAWTDVLDSDKGVDDLPGDEGTTNGTTAVTMVDAGASGHRLGVMGFTVNNNDTVAATVTVRVTDGGVSKRFCKITLDPGDVLVYRG